MLSLSGLVAELDGGDSSALMKSKTWLPTTHIHTIGWSKDQGKITKATSAIM